MTLTAIPMDYIYIYTNHAIQDHTWQCVNYINKNLTLKILFLFLFHALSFYLLENRKK